MHEHGRGGVVGAVVPLTGRYAPQGEQVRLGLELWSRATGAQVRLEDDESVPARSVACFRQLVALGCRFVIPPYGGDCVRAVARALPGSVVWNHGAAADDVQQLPAVVSLPTPSSRYLVALGRAVAERRPGASVVVVADRGPFARSARDAFGREAPDLGLRLRASFAFSDSAEQIAAAHPDAVLVCGAAQREVELLRSLSRLAPRALLGGVSPGLSAFPALLQGDPDGFLAPVQWHPDVATAPTLGPASADVAAAARAHGGNELDYVGAQAYAAALVAERCLELDPANPLSAARDLRTTTFFGDFELDAATGVQRAHRLAVVVWRGGRRVPVLGGIG